MSENYITKLERLLAMVCTSMALRTAPGDADLEELHTWWTDMGKPDGKYIEENILDDDYV